MSDNHIAPFAGNDAAEVKRSAANVRADLTRTVSEMERQQAEMRADLDRQRATLEAEFRAKRAELEARMGPLREQLSQMQEVMWTVDLYLGRDESLRLLRDGAPASAETPITIRQRVLVMAEESLVLMNQKTTGMTADDIPVFVDWLLQSPEHLNRVLPEQRGVVVLVPTRVQSKTGNPWEDAARNEANQSSWWLLRNGERLYLLNVDPDLRIGDRVLPRRNEFVEVFDQRLFGVTHGKPLKPGSDEWLSMERRADARRRHYMRIMLVLQGIVDRTPVWQPLPPAGVNLLSLADQDAGKVVLVQDDENSIQLTDGRESFAQWQRRLNMLLRPGLRVIGNWAAQGFRDLYEDGDRWTSGYHPRMFPKTTSERPAPNVPHLIEDRRDGGFVIRFERTDQVWRRNVPVPNRPGYVYTTEQPVAPSKRASCLVMPADTWVLPYDLVTVADLTYYLNSRDNRSAHFLSMVPTIRAALEAKQAEAQTEAPFRGLLSQILINEGADAEEADRLVDDLVQWWKVANAWARPLNGEPTHEAKAIRDITTEYRARLRHGSDDITDAMVTAGRRISGVICVARNRQGAWHAYAPSRPAHDAGVFLDITPLRRDGTHGDTKTWQTIPQRSASLLHVAWAAPEWADWKFAANPRWYLTGPERDALIEEVLDRTEGLPVCVTEVYDPAQPAVRALVSYAWATGTPETTAARPTNDPFDWHQDRRGGSLITARCWLVTKDKDGARVGADAARQVSYPRSFSHYSGGSPWGDTPWWPEDAHRYSDARPRLVWSDDAVLDRLVGYKTRCAAAFGEARAQRDAVEREVAAYVSAMTALIAEKREREAKARFVEDFGADALDLWPAHAATLGLDTPAVHPRTLWGIFSIALTHGHPIVGQTLDSLAAYAWNEHQNRAPGEWHPSPGRPVDLSGYGDLVVPPVDAGGE